MLTRTERGRTIFGISLECGNVVCPGITFGACAPGRGLQGESKLKQKLLESCDARTLVWQFLYGPTSHNHHRWTCSTAGCYPSRPSVPPISMDTKLTKPVQADFLNRAPDWVTLDTVEFKWEVVCAFSSQLWELICAAIRMEMLSH